MRGQPFDFIEETLTKDWAGFRTELSRLGITPTASYTTQLMGNPAAASHGDSPTAGRCKPRSSGTSTSSSAFQAFRSTVGGAWSTGKNLSADYIGNSFTVQSAYTAPDNGTNNLTLGEMYLQQQLFNNSLVIAAGRLAPGSTFATMPVLNHYVNAGINPVQALSA